MAEIQKPSFRRDVEILLLQSRNRAKTSSDPSHFLWVGYKLAYCNPAIEG